MTLQIRKHLIDDKHKPFIRIWFFKWGHHLFQLLIIGHRGVVVANAIIYPPFFEILVDLICHHFPKAVGTADFKADNLIFACDGFKTVFCFFAREQIKITGIFGDNWEKGHQMWFTRTVITNHLNAMRFMCCIKIQFATYTRNDKIFVCLRTNEGLDQTLTIIVVIEFIELDNFVDRFKLY